MAIIGDHPERGIRFVLERDQQEGGEEKASPYRYLGSAFTPTEEHRLEVVVESDGSVHVRAEAPAELKEKARLLVRTMVRHAQAEGTPPPRRILRWRPPS